MTPSAPTRLRLADVHEGDELPERQLFLAKDQVRAYARAANQWSARFTDDEGARREGLPGMITPGNMSMGLLTTLIESWAGPGVLRRLGTTFRGLVLPERTIRLCGTVTQKDEGARTVELDVWLENEDGERLVIGTATVALG
ncbi:MAG: MaoC family dehydratase N-terminal domain-containing protein [Thermoplasmata archaeon]|nr:MaoC family dehydratase N-terminal domain-containing protein [Thermoplasmata archaeon]